MGREINEEQEFSENLDRLLAGEEVKASEDVSDDYQTTISFAQKLTKLGDEPSPSFKAQLKERLLQKLAEQEAARQKEKGNWFWEGLRNLIPQNPVWRTATATVVVAVLAIVVLWGAGLFTQSPEQMVSREDTTPAMLTSPGAILELESIPSKTTAYPLGEEIKIELVFRNVSSESITLAPFPPAIQISRAENGELVRFLAEGHEKQEIPPSGTLNYPLVWNQLDDNGEEVEPGRYTIIVSDATSRKDTEAGETYLGFGLSIDLIIQPP